MNLSFEYAARILDLKPEDGPFPVEMVRMMGAAELQRRIDKHAFQWGLINGITGEVYDTLFPTKKKAKERRDALLPMIQRDWAVVRFEMRVAPRRTRAPKP
jgi:hypothetical protein